MSTEISREVFSMLRKAFTKIYSTCSDFPPCSGYWSTEWFCEIAEDLILGVEEWRNDPETQPRYYLKMEDE